MKFSQFLTEAAGQIWILFIDTGEDKRPTEVVEDVMIFSTEEKLVEHLKKVMKSELTDYFLSKDMGKTQIAAEVKKITTTKQIEALIMADDDGEYLGLYKDSFFYFKSQMDAK